MEKFSSVKKTVWDVVRSPRTASFLKVVVSVLAVYHAIDEFKRPTTQTRRK